MELEQQIFQTIAATFSVDPATININTSQHQLKGWDSLGQLRLIMQLEAEFNISFTIDEIPLLTNVEQLVNSIRAKKQG